ncbi:type-F conjugative transfer system secretin TraK (plasmid) [Providencia rustigianii]
MKKKNSRWALSGMTLLMGAMLTPALAASTATPPVKLSVFPDAQVRVGISNREPNMLVVPGDKIVSIDSAQGMLVNGDQKGTMGTANGGVILMTTQTQPFTFYVKTAGGLTVSVVAVPEKRDGRVVQLISEQPAMLPEAAKWERSLPYSTMLITLHKALLNEKTPKGFVEAPVTALPAFHLSASFQVTAEKMWNGGALRAYRLTVKNTGSTPMALPERLFHQQGVRSVVIHPYSASVLPGATARVWLTIDNLGERDGKH